MYSNLLFILLLQIGSSIRAISNPYRDHLQNDNINCTLPFPPMNGQYSVVGINPNIPSTPGTLVQNATLLYYSCDPGFEVFVAATSICQEGRWVTGFQQCRILLDAQNCVLPEFPENGDYKIHGSAVKPTPGDETRDWTVLIYSCQPLFDIIGDNITLCRDGIWSSQSTPLCRRSRLCSVPEPPVNGNYAIIGSNVTQQVGAVVEEKTILYTKCDALLRLKGGAVKACFGGYWLGDTAVCEDNGDCVLPQQLENGFYSLVGSSIPPVPGSTVEEKGTIIFSCEREFQLIGKEWSTCSQGKWSNNMPNCTITRSCVLPNPPLNGYYHVVGTEVAPTADTIVPESTVLKVYCKSPYNLVGEKTLYCESTTWSDELPECEQVEECSSLRNTQSGIYLIKPTGYSLPFPVYCDLNLNGEKWTVIQSRFNGSVNFYRNYHNYSQGFGSPQGEHWFGLEKIHQLTKDKKHELYIDLESFSGIRNYARYSNFSVGNRASGYTLHVSGYSGNAGDSLKPHSGMKFSTYDMDQDTADHSCAEKFKGGWWYDNCHHSNLNGFYYDSAVERGDGVRWAHLFTYSSLKSTRMLIRNRNEKQGPISRR